MSWMSIPLVHRATKAELALPVEAPQIPVMVSPHRASSLESLLPFQMQPISMSPRKVEPRYALARLTLTSLKTLREYSIWANP